MRFLNAILIKLCLGFIFGIYLGFFDFLEFKSLLLVSLSLIILLIFFRWVWRVRSIFLIISVFLFTALGSLTTYLHLPKNQIQHLVQLDLSNFESAQIQAEVSEILRSNDYSYKYILDNVKIQDKAYRGKVLWQISRDIDVSNLYVGQEVLLFSDLNGFQKAKNPQDFDYGNFMNNRNVYAIIYEDQYVNLPDNNFSINALGATQRQNIVTALDKAGFEDEHLELIQALILGQKQAIDKETYSDFAEVGVVHILAVSGLHVGIVLAILQFLLRPFRRIRKYGWPVMVILSILGLWCFAALAGFSPSVMRASTMFTFLAFGQLYRRKTNSINMLCLSALFLFIINPQLIFEVGFQLSYAAVFSIIMLYPVFSKLYQPKLKIVKVFTDTGYVSMAAQIGVLPFQLYYFHQFPGLFLVGNLVIIPFLGILLSGGILCIFLAFLGILINPIVEIYSLILNGLLYYVEWLSQFEELIFQNLFFTKPMFLVSVILAVTFMFMMREFKRTRILLLLVSTLAFAVVGIFEISKIQHNSEVIIFHKSRQTIIGVKHGQRLKICSDTLPMAKNPYWLKNYKLLNRVKDSKFSPLQNFYNLQDEQLVVVDSSGVYLSEGQGNIVLLTGSPDIHLGKLIQKLKPKQIVVDGNNYKSYVERWRETSQKYKISFYNTYEKGALSFNLHE